MPAPVYKYQDIPSDDEDFESKSDPRYLARANNISVPMTMAFQAGWGCQLYAIAAVLHSLYLNRHIQGKPLPARKRDSIYSSADRRASAQSLRQIAKRKYGLTEILDDPEELLFLAEQHKDIVATCMECSREEHYIFLLMAAVDNNLTAIVHFDVSAPDKFPNGDENKAFGQPICSRGENIHAAIVTGYRVTDQKEIKFKIRQWNETFEIDAKELFLSASQLPFKSETLKSYTKVEIESKRVGYHSTEGAWYPKDKLTLFHPKPKEKKTPENNQILKWKEGFANKIILIDTTHRITNLVRQLSLRVRKIRKDKSALAIQKAEALDSLIRVLTTNKHKDVLFRMIHEWKNTEYEAGMTNWDLIKQHRYQGCFSFLNGSRTRSQKAIEEALSVIPRV